MCSTKAARGVRLRLCHWGGVAQPKKQWKGRGGGKERGRLAQSWLGVVSRVSLSLSHSIAGGARLPASLAEAERRNGERGGGGGLMQATI